MSLAKKPSIVRSLNGNISSMHDLGIWVAPLTFLPGVGLLILSTSARYSILKADIKQYLRGHADGTSAHIDKQILRGHLLRNTLICFYICVTLLAISSLFTSLFGESISGEMVMRFMVSLNVLFVLLASIFLIIESSISLELIKLDASAWKALAQKS